MAGGGLALKGLSWFLRGIEFCCCAIILGIYSYYLAVLSDHHLAINNYTRAVEGISGAGVLYTLFALVLVCFLGGIAFFSFLGMLLDLAFVGAFIFVAWATRGGSGSCKGYVNTPIGSGDTANGRIVASNANGVVILPSLRTACKLETAAFAVAIVAIVFFFLSIFIELALARHHKKEKAFGPSPNNGYTAGSPKRKFWQRKPKNRDAEFAAGGLAEKPDALPAHATPGDATRQSYATDATAVGTEPTYNKYGTGSAHPMSATGHQTTTTTHTGTAADGAAYTPYNPSGATGTY